MIRLKKLFLLIAIVLSIHHPSAEPLRYYADKTGFNIGVAIKESYITGNNTTHNNLVKSEFNTAVCENAMKAISIAPSKNSYNFTVPDQVVEFARSNNMKMRGHTLVWFDQNPSWLATGTRQSLLDNMKYHIEKVMTHYKGKIFQWDVVNEPFADSGGGFRESAWYKIIGEDYIDSAFAFAHRVDPDSKLFLNDYNNTYTTDKSTAMYNKVRKMVESGIPIDGVGFQCHERCAKKAPDLYRKIKDNFDRFAALGLEIAITELDIRLWDSTLAVQGEVYGTFLRVALDEPKCKTFVVWGVRDTDSWIEAGQYPLLFDNEFTPKPAYDTVKAILANQIVGIDEGDDGQRFSHNNTTFPHDGSGGHSVAAVFDLRGVKIEQIVLDNRADASCVRSNNVLLIRGKSMYAKPLRLH